MTIQLSQIKHELNWINHISNYAQLKHEAHAARALHVLTVHSVYIRVYLNFMVIRYTAILNV